MINGSKVKMQEIYILDNEFIYRLRMNQSVVLSLLVKIKN